MADMNPTLNTNNEDNIIFDYEQLTKKVIIFYNFLSNNKKYSYVFRA